MARYGVYEIVGLAGEVGLAELGVPSGFAGGSINA